MMKAVKIKMPFGMNQNNTMAHIADVENGKKCNCFCPDCKSPLIAANKGKKNQSHFRHALEIECKGGVETAIHLAAKQEIMKRKQITLPEHSLSLFRKDSRGLSHLEKKTFTEKGQVIDFDSIQEEASLYNIIPDILAEKRNKQLIIEIYYRHKVDDKKIEKIKKANLSAIEINLSELTPEDLQCMESFWSYINDSQHIEWLHHAKEANHLNTLNKRLEEKIQAQERAYKQEEIDKQKKKQYEQKRLSKAFKDIKLLSSKEYIAYLKQKAETHPIWHYHKKYIPFSWNDLPDFVNADIPNGDWIFGCDRRIWQTAVYNYFICNKKIKTFSVKNVDKWLQNTNKLKVSESTRIVGIYSRKYPALIPADISDNIPSSWKTLQAYFNYLCKLGFLSFFADGLWFKFEEKTLGTAQKKGHPSTEFSSPTDSFLTGLEIHDIE